LSFLPWQDYRAYLDRKPDPVQDKQGEKDKYGEAKVQLSIHSPAVVSNLSRRWERKHRNMDRVLQDALRDDIRSHGDKHSDRTMHLVSSLGQDADRNHIAIRKWLIRQQPSEPALAQDFEVWILNLKRGEEKVGRALLNTRDNADPTGPVPPLYDP
jgi:hypothetical protein